MELRQDISIDEIEKAPRCIRYLYACMMANSPASSSVYEDAVINHRKYFKDDMVFEYGRALDIPVERGIIITRRERRKQDRLKKINK